MLAKTVTPIVAEILGFLVFFGFLDGFAAFGKDPLDFLGFLVFPMDLLGVMVLYSVR